MGAMELPIASLLLLFVTFEAVAAVSYCPPFWTHYELDHGIFCYRFFGKRATWSEAEVTCAGFSSCKGEEMAHIVSMTSAEEEMFITEYRQSISGMYGGGDPGMWIGFSDRGDEGQWGWLDMSPVNYTNWHRGEPSDSAHMENCARQIVPMMGIAVWVDSSCNEKHPYVCKMPAQ
eukprot:XP_011682221.1 PREDICTED: echinoidin-like [Strongylocentrotus purpuratus]